MTACFGIQEVTVLVTNLAMTMKIIKHEFHIRNILELISYLTEKISVYHKNQTVNPVNELIALYCENHMKHNTVCGQNTD